MPLKTSTTTASSYLACVLVFVRNGYLDCLKGIEYIELHEESIFLVSLRIALVRLAYLGQVQRRVVVDHMAMLDNDEIYGIRVSNGQF